MRWIVIMGMAGVLAGCAGADLMKEQSDPATATPPSSPNWALAAPREVKTAAAKTHDVPIFATGAEDLLAYLDTIVLADDRIEAIEPVWATAGSARAYVERSSVFGFPDVITVEAIDLGFGDAGQRASLIIYSRAVYGYSDLGVNGERIDRWLAGLSEVAPVVSGRGVDG